MRSEFEVWDLATTFASDIAELEGIRGGSLLGLTELSESWDPDALSSRAILATLRSVGYSSVLEWTSSDSDMTLEVLTSLASCWLVGYLVSKTEKALGIPKR